jgi:hypothetical protein
MLRFVSSANTSFDFTNLIIPANDNTNRNFTFSRSGSNYTASVEGIGSQTIAGDVANAAFDRIGSWLDIQWFHGILSDININGVAAYTGIGTSVTAWQDTIGSNDGTESGAFTSVTEAFKTIPITLGAGFDGDQSDIRFYDSTGLEAAHWKLADHADLLDAGLNGLTVADSGVNQLHGTCTGCNGATGEGIDADVAGIVGLDDARWFNGTDTSVSLPSKLITDVHNFDITFSIVAQEVTVAGTIYGQGSTTDNAPIIVLQVPLATPTKLELFIRDDQNSTIIKATSIADVADGLPHECRVVNANGNVTFYVDGVLDKTDSYTPSGVFSFNTEKIGSLQRVTEGAHFDGVIYGIETASNAYTGRGATPWQDTIGSNDGTEIGSFVSVGQKRATIPQTGAANWNKYDKDTLLLSATGTMLVAASDANDQIDAFGTAILEPRTNNEVVNLFGDGEKATTLASASLDTIKTVSGWIWHDGAARTVIDLGTPTVGTTTTTLTSSGFTGVTYFVNGVGGATLSAGWNHCVVASTAALDCDNIDILAKSGSLLDYDLTATVDIALQNYTAQKSKYGL